MSKDSDQAARQSAGATGQEQVGTLTIWRHKGHLVNHAFDYVGELPDGSYSIYAAPIGDNGAKDFRESHQMMATRTASGPELHAALSASRSDETTICGMKVVINPTMPPNEMKVVFPRAQPAESKRVELTDDEIRSLRKASAVLCGTGHYDEAREINGLLARAQAKGEW